MGRLNDAWKALTGNLLKPIAPQGPFSASDLTILNGQIISSSDNKKAYIDQYLKNDTIYAVVKKVANKVKMAPWAAYKVVDDEALQKSNKILAKKQLTRKEVKEAIALRKKALEPYADNRLSELLRFPNSENATFQDLVADSSTYKMITGDRYIWAEMLNGGANTGKPYRLHLMPPQDVTIVATKTWPIEITAYNMKTWGITEKTLSKQSVLHDKYFNPDQTISGDHLYGLSPLKAGRKLADRSNSEDTAATASFQNGGPKSVLWMKYIQGMDPAFAESQVKAVKAKLSGREYGGAENTNKFAVSGYEMGATPLGLSPVDLDLNASQMATMRRFCALYDVPSQLMNDNERSTYNTVVEAQKALTVNAALPLLNDFRDSFNRKLGTDWGYSNTNVIIDYDISVYSELQEDQSAKWGWVKDLPVPNGYKLDMMGLDHPEGQEEFMETILIPSGYGTSDDTLRSDTDAALEEGDEFAAEGGSGEDLQE